MFVHDALTYWGQRTPTSPFVVSASRVVTWGQADAATDRIARALIASGLGPGDRIAVLSRNDPELPLVFFGALKAGVVPVPLNVRLAPAEWAYIVHDSGAKAFFCGGELVDQVLGLRDRCPTVERWISWTEVAPEIVGLDDWTASASDRPLPAIPSPDADACQLYTSGTTGKPKGAVLTHAGMQAGHLRCTLAGISLDPTEVFYMFLPLSLAGGLSMACNSWVQGAGVRLDDFSPERAVAALDDGVAAVNATPTMLRMCLEVEGAADREYRDLRWILYGGSPCPVELVRRVSDVFGCGLVGAYGQTEFFTNLALMPDEHVAAMAGQDHLLRSVGRPLPGIEAVVVDPAGAPVATGEEGELCLRGAGALSRYWQDPDKTAASRLGDLHRTGDVARIDDQGYVYLVDRANDMIKSGGMSVFSREVEVVLEEIPGVHQVAVIGVPSERWGEEVKAVVVRDEGSTITEADLVAACRQHLGGFKVPKSVDFVDELPMSALGKVVKHELRARYRRD